MTNDYFMTVTERTAAIRAALKERGYTSRQVSVKASRASLCSSIDIQIKDASVSRNLVEAIAEPYESISRCSITGDILSGGNTYLHVSYSKEAQDILTAQYRVVVADAAMKAHDTTLIPIAGTPFFAGIVGSFGHPRMGVAIWQERGHILDASDVDEAAAFIGRQMGESMEVAR